MKISVLIMFLVLAACGFGELRIPDALYGSQVDLSTATADTNGVNGVRKIGDTVAISAIADAGGGDVTITATAHGLIAGNTITIDTVASDYDGLYTVKSVTDADNFVITETFGGTSTGTFVDTYYDSPLGGTVWRFFIASGRAYSYASIDFPSNVNFYPNTSWIWRFERAGTDGSPSNISFMLCPGTSLSSRYRTPSWAYGHTGWTSGAWNVLSNRRSLMTRDGTVADWCTTQENQAFSTKRVSMYLNFSFATDSVLYLGGVVTENVPKAKVIFTFDDFSSTVVSYAYPRIRAKGWKAAVCAKGSDMDTETNRGYINTLYNAGWDIINHTWTHTNYQSGDASNSAILADILKNKAWIDGYSWQRGSKIFTVPFVAYDSITGDIGDILENHVWMTLGLTERERYGNADRNGSLTINTVSPYFPDDFMNIGRTSDASSTTAAQYAAGSTLKSTLASAVLTHGVVVVMLHSVVPEDDSYGNIEEWFDAMIADVAAYEAAGVLEVSTMSDWYGELVGVDLSQQTITTRNGARYNSIY